MRRLVIFVVVWMGTGFALLAQDKCAYDVYQKKLLENNPGRAQDQFEYWMRQKLSQRALNGLNNRSQAGPYKVPVVVHIIHNGEPVGTGTNLSEAQVLSQIKVLNNDYQRLNADAVNTPSVFNPLHPALIWNLFWRNKTLKGSQRTELSG